jgi:hypothetical protein
MLLSLFLYVLHFATAWAVPLAKRTQFNIQWATESQTNNDQLGMLGEYQAVSIGTSATFRNVCG